MSFPDIRSMGEYGIHLPGYSQWMDDNNMRQLAMDSAMLAMDAPVTGANSAVPVELGTYFHTQVIEVLTAVRKARAIYDEEKHGDWATPLVKYRSMEFTGQTEPYGDNANAGSSDTNYNWASREPYLFQTIITYGDLEEAVTALAKINLARDKQLAAANIIDIDQNKFYMLGVAGLQNYGLLNDPQLTATISPATKAAGGVLWSVATTKEKYDDCLLLFQRLVNQCNGNVDKDSKLKLCMSPGLAVDLGSATDFNVSVLDMLNKYFSNLTIVTAPEYYNASTGETMQFIAEEVMGMPTGKLAFTEKIKAGRIVLDLSNAKQKFTAGTVGYIGYIPAGIAQMRGM